MPNMAFAFLQSAFLDAQHGGIFWSVVSMQVLPRPRGGSARIWHRLRHHLCFDRLLRTNRRSIGSGLRIQLIRLVEKHAHDPEKGAYHEQLDRMGVPIPMHDSQTDAGNVHGRLVATLAISR